MFSDRGDLYTNWSRFWHWGTRHSHGYLIAKCLTLRSACPKTAPTAPESALSKRSSKDATTDNKKSWSISIPSEILNARTALDGVSNCRILKQTMRKNWHAYLSEPAIKVLDLVCQFTNSTHRLLWELFVSSALTWIERQYKVVVKSKRRTKRGVIMNIRKVSYLFVAVTVMSGFSFQPTEADTSGAVGIISGKAFFRQGNASACSPRYLT